MSPLIALMVDQVARLNELGIPAACLHSQVSAAVRADSLRAAAAGELRFLYLAPERIGAHRLSRKPEPPCGGTVRRRRGALHLQLGPRLPPRVPASRRGDRRVRTPARRCVHRHRDAARPRGHRREPRSARAGRARHRIRPREPDDVGHPLPRRRRETRRGAALDPSGRRSRARLLRQQANDRRHHRRARTGRRVSRVVSRRARRRFDGRASTRDSPPDACRRSSPRPRSAWASTFRTSAA